MDDASNPKKQVMIVTPAMAAANNGNWRTADRWANFLDDEFQVTVHGSCDAGADLPDAMIALHARRSAAAIAAFAATGRPLCVVLTGTDLYRDIRTDPAARRSLDLADRLVVLQARGLDELTPAWREKCVVIEQSAPALPPLPPRESCFDLLLVGHLRAEKDPLTAARAMGHLGAPMFRLRQIGRADDADIGPAFKALALADPRIEMLGNLPHPDTREQIRRGRILLLPSLMEGGANVLIEAVVSQVPVLASCISGSIGMLGDDYPGYFDVGDDAALARLIDHCANDAGFFDDLRRHCAARAALFDPQREKRLTRRLLNQMLT